MGLFGNFNYKFDKKYEILTMIGYHHVVYQMGLPNFDWLDSLLQIDTNLLMSVNTLLLASGSIVTEYFLNLTVLRRYVLYMWAKCK